MKQLLMVQVLLVLDIDVSRTERDRSLGRGEELYLCDSIFKPIQGIMGI